MVLLTDAGRFDPARAAFTTYVYGIVRNLSRHRVRRERPVRRSTSCCATAATSTATTIPSKLVEGAQLAGAVRRALISLPSRYRELIVLCDLHDLSYEDAAAVVGAIGRRRAIAAAPRAGSCSGCGWRGCARHTRCPESSGRSDARHDAASPGRRAQRAGVGRVRGRRRRGRGAVPRCEARVLRAAQAALTEKQRADAERARRRWFAGISAIAASLLAAAAWSLAPGAVNRAARLWSPARRRLGSSTAPESPAASSGAQARRDAPAGASCADDQHRGRPRARDAAAAAGVTAAVRSERRRRPRSRRPARCGAVVRCEPSPSRSRWRRRRHAARRTPRRPRASAGGARRAGRPGARGVVAASQAGLRSRRRRDRAQRCPCIASITRRQFQRPAQDPPAPPK